jgi:hypothetical protein
MRWAMKIVLAATALYLGCAVIAQSQSIPISETKALSRWDGGNSVVFFGRGLRKPEFGPIRGYVRGQQRGSDIDLFRDFPGLDHAAVDDITGGPNDSTYIVVLLNFGQRQMRQAILAYDRAGKLTRELDAASHFPKAITVDDDGSVYVLGSRIGSDGAGKEPPYPLIVKYTAEGKVSREFLPSDTFKEGAGAFDHDELMNASLVKRGKLLFVYAPAGREVLVFNLEGNILHCNLTSMFQQWMKTDGTNKIRVNSVGFLDDERAIIDTVGVRATDHVDTIVSNDLYIINLKTAQYERIRAKDRRWRLLGAEGDEVTVLKWTEATAAVETVKLAELR